MFLARDQIKDFASRGKLIGEHFCASYLRQSSYDLRLGDEVYVVGKLAPTRLSDRAPYISLPPGQFALLTCYEEIEMTHTHMALIAVRSTFKFQGLVNISGFHVDPTHRGKLLFAVQNVGPSDIRLKYKEPTFSIFFAELKGDIGEDRESEPQTHFKKLRGIRLQDVQLLGGSSVTISKLQKEIDKLKIYILVYGSIIVAGFIAVVVDLIKNWGPRP